MEKPFSPPQKPQTVTAQKFNNFEVVTQGNINQILEDISKLEREPLDHVCLPYQDYLTLAAYMENLEGYILGSEAYFRKIDEMS